MTIGTWHFCNCPRRDDDQFYPKKWPHNKFPNNFDKIKVFRQMWHEKSAWHESTVVRTSVEKTFRSPAVPERWRTRENCNRKLRHLELHKSHQNSLAREVVVLPKQLNNPKMLQNVKKLMRALCIIFCESSWVIQIILRPGCSFKRKEFTSAASTILNTLRALPREVIGFPKQFNVVKTC